MKQKKGQGLSFNTIIIAILSLVVLVVLIAIFSGYSFNFSRSFGGTCEEQGGRCSDNGECNNPELSRKVYAQGCTYYVRNAKGEYEEAKDKKAGQCCLPSLT